MNASTIGTDSQKNGFAALISRLRANPKIPLLVAASAAIAIIVAGLLWAKSPDYKVLFSNLNDRDGGAIVSQLTQLNIPYRFNENGTALLIPAQQVYETRLRLAQQGLPKGGNVGFELMDQEKFGISQFSEQVNYQRSLEGELARTINTLGPVTAARVHLALPKPSLFVREQKDPSASVTVTLQSGRALDDGQINSIVYIVSSSVSGMPPANVTVVDQNGRLLTQGDEKSRDLNTTQLKYAHEVESRYQRRIEAILAPIVGAGNVHAQVTATIDFSTREQTDEQYQPNQQPGRSAVRSQQLSQNQQSNGTPNGGVPGALSNQPSPPPTAPIENPPAARPTTTANAPAPAAGNAGNNAAVAATGSSGSSGPQSSRRDETINYEVDRTIRHTQFKSGNVERLSVGVVVNYLPTGPDGKMMPLDKNQLTQIEALVRESVGYSAQRGDSVNVVNTHFTDQPNLDAELPFWQQQAFFDQLMSAGRYLLVLLAAWLLWIKLVRPALRKQQAEQQTLRMTPAMNMEAMGASTNNESKPNKEELALRRKSQQRVSVEVQSQRIRELADQDPRVVALVIRQWMSKD